jgi:hypothetical protein
MLYIGFVVLVQMKVVKVLKLSGFFIGCARRLFIGYHRSYFGQYFRASVLIRVLQLLFLHPNCSSSLIYCFFLWLQILTGRYEDKDANAIWWILPMFAKKHFRSNCNMCAKIEEIKES